MTNCIEWQGYRMHSGHGQLKHKKKNELAHRVAYCEANGLDIEDIKGVVVRHKCDNPPCINPDHLELGTITDNNRDKMERGRWHGPVGEAHPDAKLTEEAVRWIRSVYTPHHPTLGCRALARKFKVDPKAIQNVVTNKTWRNV